MGDAELLEKRRPQVKSLKLRVVLTTTNVLSGMERPTLRRPGYQAPVGRFARCAQRHRASRLAIPVMTSSSRPRFRQPACQTRRMLVQYPITDTVSIFTSPAPASLIRSAVMRLRSARYAATMVTVRRNIVRCAPPARHRPVPLVFMIFPARPYTAQYANKRAAIITILWAYAPPLNSYSSNSAIAPGSSGCWFYVLLPLR